MKLELTKDANGKTIGYNLNPENEDEKRKLGTIRNQYFFASVKYDGIESKDNFVTKMKFLFKQL